MVTRTRNVTGRSVSSQRVKVVVPDMYPLMFHSRELGWSLSNSTSATKGLEMTIRLITRRVWMIRDSFSTRLISASGLVDRFDQVVDVASDLLI